VSTRLLRSVVPAALLLFIAACTSSSLQEALPPELAALAGETGELSSLVALAEVLELDLDQASAGGGVTVFAPSNALVLAYAQFYEFTDTAELLAWLATASAEQRAKWRNFVRAHLFVYEGGPMTEAFLVDDVGDGISVHEAEQAIDGGVAWTYVMRNFVPGVLALAVAPATEPVVGSLRLQFGGTSPAGVVSATVETIEFIAADIAFADGIVHVIDGSIVPLTK